MIPDDDASSYSQRPSRAHPGNQSPNHSGGHSGGHPGGGGRPRPRHLDVDKTQGVTIEWDDGTRSHYSVLLLRRMSPSADARALRDEMAHNPLTVLPSSPPVAGPDSSAAPAPLTITDLEPVGLYAIRFRFSDGHDTGLYSWDYLHDLAGETRP